MSFPEHYGPAISLHDVLSRHPFNDIPLDVAALAIACSFCSRVDIKATLKKIDQLTEEAARVAGPMPTEERLVSALKAVLFRQHGFQGNCENYYAPENSFLNCVLETRRGIPISLSLLMIEVGRRLNLPLVGIGLPCHFVVGLHQEEKIRFFDPFHGGVERTREECTQLANVLSGGSVAVTECHFMPLPRPLFLTRMLANLRSIYRQRSDTRNLATTLRHLLLLAPGDPNIHFELSLALIELGQLALASNHLTVCEELAASTECDLPLADVRKKLVKVMALMN